MNARSRNLVVAAVAVVVLLFVVAVVASGGGGDGGDDAAVPQYRAVRVTGGELPTFESAEGDPAVGRSAPALVGRSFAGAAVRISPDDGRPKLLVFLAHWCPHCRAEVPVLRRWIDGGGAEGVEVYGISTSATDDRPNWPPSAWLERERWPAPVLVDDRGSSAAIAYGLSAFPYFVLIGADGDVVARGSGELAPGQLTQLVGLVR
jgi:thiol-disulfide isomerase/thioredoxin